MLLSPPVHRHRRVAAAAVRDAAYPVRFEPYTAAHVLTQLQLLLFSGLAFFVMLGYLKRTPTITLDSIDAGDACCPRSREADRRGDRAVLDGIGAAVALARGALARVIARERLPAGRFARTVPTASMALWVMLMLAGTADLLLR